MKKKTWIGWGVALLVFILFYLLSVSTLRAQMEATLSSACNRPVTIRSARMVLPPGIQLTGIEVPTGYREAHSPLSMGVLTARLAAGQAVQGQPALELDFQDPKLYGEWNLQTQALFSLASLKGTSTPIPLPLARLRINGGALRLVDETVVPPTDWDLRDVRGEVAAASGPGQYHYRFSGRLVGKGGEDLGGVEVEGTWISGGPVEGTLQVRHADLHFLAPYLRKVLGTPPSQGSAELTTHLTLHQGVVMARNDVTAEKVLFPVGAATSLDMEGNRLVELLRDEEGKVHLGFIVAGKLGQKLDWSDLATGALREATRQALSRSIQKMLKETEQVRPAEEVLQEKFESTPH